MTHPNESQATAADTDEDLVARLARRDEGALRVLHRRYAPLVFTIAARVVGAATAEDVVQDVFVTVWNQHDRFDAARGSFKSWIVQITRRRALNELRRDPNRRARGEDLLADVPDEGLLPDEAQWLAHQQRAIRAAVDALPAPQRQALSLAFFGELSHEQVASVLRTPVGTTKTRIRSALKRLAPVLAAVLAATIVALLVRRRDLRAARDERALRMVTASDAVVLHLRPAPGVSADAHGNFRARPGVGIAVLTTSHLPMPAAPDVYVAWAHRANGWRSLGPVTVEGDGRSLLVTDGETELDRSVPDELRVTREPREGGSAPLGPAVLTWSAADVVPP